MKELVTETNWRDSFNQKKCPNCSGQGTLGCSVCGKFTDLCYCTESRTFETCTMCDGEGNLLAVPRKEIH